MKMFLLKIKNEKKTNFLCLLKFDSLIKKLTSISASDELIMVNNALHI